MASNSTQFTALYEISDGQWTVELLEEPRVHTYGRSLAVARDHLLEAIELWFEVDPGQYSVTDQLPDSQLNDAVTFGVRAREEAERAADVATVATSTAARRLSDGRFSRRDIASLLDISHQRVQQILTEDAGHYRASVAVVVSCAAEHDCDDMVMQLVADALDDLDHLVDEPTASIELDASAFEIAFSLTAKDETEAARFACAVARSAVHAAGASTRNWEHEVNYPSPPVVELVTA